MISGAVGLFRRDGNRAPLRAESSSEACLYAEFCLPRKSGEAVIYLGPRSLAASSSLPGAVIPFRRTGRSGPLRTDALFGLAPRGVCTAVTVARDAVSSYLAISPLPQVRVSPFRWRYLFCCTFRRLSRAGLPRGIGRPAVSWHAALWSSDVPPPGNRGATARHAPDG